jgi:branched-chain amino acid transport system substrate-binding protein
MNQKKVPQVFVATGASKWNDPKNFPWTMGWQPDYYNEGKMYASHLLKTKPSGKVAVLFQNDDYGKDYLKGFKDGLGDKVRTMIISEVSYEVTDPTIDSQMVQMKGSGADVFMNITTPKFAAMAIKKAADIGWKPVHYLNNVSASVGSVLTPAGLENSTGVISMQYVKDPTDREFANEPATNEWRAWMKKYYPEGNVTDAFNVVGHAMAETLTIILKACGDSLTRENFMRQAASMKDVRLQMALPGITLSTSPTDFAPFQSMQIVRFDGKQWAKFGDLVSR